MNLGELEINKVYNEDCIVGSNKIQTGSVDLILTDPPYGNMNGAKLDGWSGNKTSWDLEIEPRDLFNIAERVLRKNGKMILFSQEPYTSKLINEVSNNITFNYRMIWEKDHFANSLIAKKAPVSYFEDILVFSKDYDIEGLHPLREYFKQIMDYIGLNLKDINKKLGHRKAEHSFYVNSKKVGQKADHVIRLGSTQFELCTEKTYLELIEVFHIDKMVGFKTYENLKNINDKYSSTFNLWEGKKYKSNILKYKKDYEGLHPTQKPILLIEDLIKTYSRISDLVVDLTMGSGTTIAGCINTNRNYIGFEKEKKYFDIAVERIEKHK